jgi:hypothetical protein
MEEFYFTINIYLYKQEHIMNDSENTIICARCGLEKERHNFYSRSNGKPLSYCSLCQKEVKELKLLENLERIVEERGGSCADCNGIFPTPLYEFYKDGQVFQISKAKNMSFQKIKADLNDYIMICRNCSGLRRWAI